MSIVNFENALEAVSEYLQEKVADRLDVNRNHIFVTKITTETIWELESEDGYQCARMFAYREDASEDNWMVWYHKENNTGAFKDIIMTEEEFDAGFDNGEEE